jgi:hypothetical protein
MAKAIIGFLLIALFFSGFAISSINGVPLVAATTYGPVSGGGPQYGGNKDDGGYSVSYKRQWFDFCRLHLPLYPSTSQFAWLQTLAHRDTALFRTKFSLSLKLTIIVG